MLQKQARNILPINLGSKVHLRGESYCKSVVVFEARMSAPHLVPRYAVTWGAAISAS